MTPRSPYLPASPTLVNGSDDKPSRSRSGSETMEYINVRSYPTRSGSVVDIGGDIERGSDGGRGVASTPTFARADSLERSEKPILSPPLQRINTAGSAAAAPASVLNGGRAPMAQRLHRQLSLGGKSTITLDDTQPGWPEFHRKFANPAPFGLACTGMTLLTLSLNDLHAAGVHNAQVVNGLALFVGGLGQLLAGLWEVAAGNTLAATAFLGYGNFWLSWWWVTSDFSGVSSSYVDQTELNHSIGLYLCAYGIFTTMLLFASFRSSVGLVIIFFTLMMAFWLFAVSYWYPDKPAILSAGAGFGIACSAACWYVAAAGLMTKDTAPWTLPVGDLSRKKRN